MTEIDLDALRWRYPVDDDRHLRMVVLGDSTCFCDHKGPQLPTEPALYPNVAAERLSVALDREVDVTIVARPGTTVRTVHEAVTKDRHVMFGVLQGADMVVVGFGGFDHGPIGVPPVVDAVVPFMRPDGLRRRVRKGLHAAYPWLVRLSGGRRPRTHESTFDRLYDDLFVHVRGLSGGAPGVALGPTSSHSAYYGWRRGPHVHREGEQLAIAASHGYATRTVWDLVLPHRDALNVDGIHWPHEVHRAVGEEVADLLLPQLTGQQPVPGFPEF